MGYELIKPLGILTYVLMLLALTSGLLRWKLKYHKLFAIAAIITATAHFLIIVILNG